MYIAYLVSLNPHTDPEQETFHFQKDKITAQRN